jgi:hypothetical protein
MLPSIEPIAETQSSAAGIADSATTKTNRAASERRANRGDFRDTLSFGVPVVSVWRYAGRQFFSCDFDQAAFAAVFAIGPFWLAAIRPHSKLRRYGRLWNARLINHVTAIWAIQNDASS